MIASSRALPFGWHIRIICGADVGLACTGRTAAAGDDRLRYRAMGIIHGVEITSLESDAYSWRFM